jgi:single-strand DNA-binding protein
MSINKVILIGNLGKDPEVRTMSSGSRVCTFSLATSERWKGKDGQQQERTEWHSIVIFNEHIVNVAEKYLAKGNKIYLEGQLQTREWQDKNGNSRKTTEVVLNRYRGELQMVGEKSASEHKPQESTTGSDDYISFDDEIPF